MTETQDEKIYLNTAYFPKCSWNFQVLFKNALSFPEQDGSQDRQLSWNQLPLTHLEIGSPQSRPCWAEAGKKMSIPSPFVLYAPTHFPHHSNLPLKVTSWSSGSSSPAARKTAGLLLLQPMLVTHCCAPRRAILWGDSGCSALLLWLGLSFLSVWHVHTQQLPLAWSLRILCFFVFFSKLASLAHQLVRWWLLRATVSDLFQCILKDCCLASVACMSSLSLLVSFHPFKPPFQIPFGSSEFSFSFFFGDAGCLW